MKGDSTLTCRRTAKLMVSKHRPMAYSRILVILLQITDTDKSFFLLSSGSEPLPSRNRWQAVFNWISTTFARGCSEKHALVTAKQRMDVGLRCCLPRCPIH